MRRRTRIAALVVLGIVVFLLALGALPSLIKSGDPYYLTATPVEEHSAVNVSDLDERRYPYTAAAMAAASEGESGRSDRYWKGYIGFKEAFTHSPFDEIDALRQRNPDANDGDAIYVRDGDRYYRVTITQELGGTADE
ncbi:hypothetical protein Hrd1104_10065 [Halorhabdus sp. CBA1104]|uniref:hypothetical protein n=1 Tax=unclassified Halorhabdus TaxID=2621901 RepID=UPI0012B1F5B6|nr:MULTISPECIES: hypothetical protein [unclassified Halorhabdus]QGN07610.1 hypothetical protein Hrd1104_10065 [Halorhabdus sp. CBA1104]